MVRSKWFAAVFSFAAAAVLSMPFPLYAAEKAEIVQPDIQQNTDTYEVCSAAQLAAALNGTCMDASYRTLYDSGRIHITMKNVSVQNGEASYALSSNIITAHGKQFILDMNGLDLYASGTDGQGTVSSPVIIVPPSSSLVIQSTWMESAIRNISINNQGYLKIDGVNVIPAAGQAVYNMGTSDLADCDLYAGRNSGYAVINEGGTLTLDGGEGQNLSVLNGIYNIGSGGRDARLNIKNGFHITDMQGRAVVNNGGFVRVGELAEKNSSVIDGSQMGILTMNGGSTEMYDGTVQGGIAAVSTSPNAFLPASAGKTGGSFSMIGGTLTGGYGVAFQADSYVHLKAGTVRGEQGAVASVAYDGNLTENIASYQFYNTNSEEADAYYYDESAKTNILCTEIRDGKMISADQSMPGETETEPALSDGAAAEEEVLEEAALEMVEVTVGGQDIYWNEEYESSASEETPAGDPRMQFPMPADIPEAPAELPVVSDFYTAQNINTQKGQAGMPHRVSSCSGIRDGTAVPGRTAIRDGTYAFCMTGVRDGTRMSDGFGIRDGTE